MTWLLRTLTFFFSGFRWRVLIIVYSLNVFFFLSWSAAVVSTERGIHVPALWKALQAAVKCCDHTKARIPPYLMLLTAACSGGRSDSSRSSSSSYRYMHDSRNNNAVEKKKKKRKRTEERVNPLTRKTIISYELSRWYLYCVLFFITNKNTHTHTFTDSTKFCEKFFSKHINALFTFFDFSMKNILVLKKLYNVVT